MKLQTSLIALALLVGCAEVDADGDGKSNVVDCDDNNATIFPGAQEFCDGIDNDCNDVVDDAYATNGVVFFIDQDGDGFGTAAASAVACPDAAPEGFVPDASDCDDDNPNIYPTAPELCNLVDDNCNGSVDDDPEDAPIWYADYDLDGFGSRTLVRKACEGPTGWIKRGGDCNDFDFYVNPNALEYCDRIDNDCDDVVDEPDAEDHSVFYKDDDGDGYGNIDKPIDACYLPEGYAVSNEDCNDDPANNGTLQVPYTEEICRDGLDNNCNGDGDQCAYTSWTDSSFAKLHIKGSGSSAYLGNDIELAGDVNGDGYDDFVIGAYRMTIESSYTGAGFLLYGAPEGTYTEKSVKATDLPHFYTQGTYDYVGRAVGPLGDIDGDGYDDFGLGAYSMDEGYSSSGSLIIIYGKKSAYEGGLEIEDNDVPFLYGPSSSAYAGSSLGTAGDQNGDGISEFMTGAYYYQHEGKYGAGAVYLLPGASSRYTGRTELGSVGAKFVGSDSYWYLGYFGPNMDSGDLNGDGRSDIVMGAYGAESYAGNIYLMYGDGTGWTGEHVAADAADVTWFGAATYAYMGRAQEILGDIDGDGYDDLTIGDYYGSNYAGNIYVLFGGSSLLKGGDPASKAEVTISGPSTGSAYMGYGRNALVDIDADGTPEFVAGSYRATVGAVSYTGGTYIFEGGADLRTGGDLIAGTDSVADIAGPATSYAYFGYNVAAGDHNGDGYGDILVAAYGDLGYAGSAFLFEGTSP